MTPLGPGQFSVTPGERINVSITKSIAPYSVDLTDLFGGGAWSPKPDNGGTLSATGGFDIPAGAGATISFGGLFNFVPSGDEGGPADFYTVTLSGAGGSTFPMPIFGPGAPTRTYTFFS
jgi:hypothetical protein